MKLTVKLFATVLAIAAIANAQSAQVVTPLQSGLANGVIQGLVIDTAGRLQVDPSGGTTDINNVPGTTDPCQNPSVMKQSAKINVTSTTASLLVAVNGSKTTYVCGGVFTIQGSATTVGTLQFEYGTQTTNPCDTGTNTLTGTFAGNINANVPTVIPLGNGSLQLRTASAVQLCAVATGTTISIQGYITFVQQ